MRKIKFLWLFLLFFSVNVWAEPFGCLIYNPDAGKKIRDVNVYSFSPTDTIQATLVPSDLSKVGSDSKNVSYGWELEPHKPERRFMIDCIYEDRTVTKTIPSDFNACIYTSTLESARAIRDYEVICLKW